MGVIRLQFEAGTTRHTLALTGAEKIGLLGLDPGLTAGMMLNARISRPDGTEEMAASCLMPRAF